MHRLNLGLFLLIGVIQFITLSKSMGQSSHKMDSMIVFSIEEYYKELHSQPYSYSTWMKNICISRLPADTNIYLLVNKNHVSHTLKNKLSSPNFPNYLIIIENGRLSAYKYNDSVHAFNKTKVKHIRKRRIGVLEVSHIDFNHDTLQINIVLSLFRKVKTRNWYIEVSEGMRFCFKYDYVKKDWICVEKKR
jgi:hypothetical protein